MTSTRQNARTATRTTGRRLTTLAAALLLALTLGACGGGSEVKVTTKDRAASSSDSPRKSEPTGDATDDATDEQTDEPTQEPGDEAGEDPDQKRALDKLVAETQGFVAQQLEANRAIYSAMTVTGSGDDTIVYSYTYAKRMDAATTAKNIEAQSDSMLQPALDSEVFPAMREVGISSPKATYVYKNNDGSVIWRKTFTPS